MPRPLGGVVYFLYIKDLAIPSLNGSERDRGLTGPWWNVNKEGQSRAQKPIL